MYNINMTDAIDTNQDIFTIKEIEITNFRGIKNLTFKNLSDVNFAFGLNGTNKSTFLFAIRLLLEEGFKNRYEFNDDDFNSFLDDDEIQLKIKMNYTSNTDNSSPWITFIGDFWAKLTVNRVLEKRYEPKLFHSLDGENWIETNKREWEWLRGINLIFIKPNYSLEESKNNMLREYKRINRDELNDEVSGFETQIKNEIKQLINNNSYAKIGGLIDTFENNKPIDYNDQGKTALDFFDMKFNLVNQTSLIYTFDNEKVKSLGDGIERIESMNFDIKYSNLKSECKISVILLEEVENNLHISLQRRIISDLKKLPSQNIFFITTHSANIIHYNKGNNFIRFSNNGNIYEKKFENTSRMSPFVEVSIAESLFHDNVYIVEGDTEIMFYNEMYIKNEKFRNVIDKNFIYIHKIDGAYGYTFHNFFKELGINAISKIDNDVNKKGIHHRIKNVIKNGMGEDIDFNKEFVEEKWDAIENELINRGVIISKQTDSFEGELSDLFEKLDVSFSREKLIKEKNKYLSEILEENEECLSGLDLKNSVDDTIFKFIKLMGFDIE